MLTIRARPRRHFTFNSLAFPACDARCKAAFPDNSTGPICQCRSKAPTAVCTFSDRGDVRDCGNRLELVRSPERFASLPNGRRISLRISGQFSRRPPPPVPPAKIYARKKKRLGFFPRDRSKSLTTSPDRAGKRPRIEQSTNGTLRKARPALK